MACQATPACSSNVCLAWAWAWLDLKPIMGKAASICDNDARITNVPDGHFKGRHETLFGETRQRERLALHVKDDVIKNEA